MNTTRTFMRKPLVAAIGGALAGTVAPAAFAQSVDADSGSLEEIVVTASRREQSIQDIPYNISAVQGDDIEAQKHHRRLGLDENDCRRVCH